MRKFAVTTILACSLAVAGCEQLFPQQDDEAEAEDEGDADSGGTGFGGTTMGGSGGPVVPKDNSQGNAGQQTPLRSWFIGQWTDDGDCDNAITMAPDGRFINADGSSGNWTLAGDQLTMAGNNDSLTVTLRQVDQNRLQLVYPDGQSGYSTRC